jgi:peptidoglycan/LPS O-acetylase OafA/YrhL
VTLVQQTESAAEKTVRISAPNHLAGLDGLRAFSVALVLLGHGAGAWSHSSDLLSKWAGLGVSTFFVMSGTLITWLMIREKEETGSLSLRDFYIRRSLRILPVFWLLIVCVIILKSVHAISISDMDIFRALTFTHNYPLGGSSDYAWWLHHTWSLSMEEQFYLIWPGLFALLVKKKSMLVAGVLAFSGPVLVLANYYLLPSLRGQEESTFHTRVGTLMMGCLAAYLLDSSSFRTWIKKVPAGPLLLAAAVFLLVIDPCIELHFKGHSAIRAVLGLVMPTVEAIVIAASVLILVAGKAGVIHWVFNQPIVAHIGKLSYGIYIWQQLFYEHGSAPTLWALLLRTLAIYGVSVCSFHFMEKPILGLRRKFRRVPTE